VNDKPGGSCKIVDRGNQKEEIDCEGFSAEKKIAINDCCKSLEEKSPLKTNRTDRKKERGEEESRKTLYPGLKQGACQKLGQDYSTSRQRAEKRKNGPHLHSKKFILRYAGNKLGATNNAGSIPVCQGKQWTSPLGPCNIIPICAGKKASLI